MKFSRQHEATITRADFVRILPAATGDSEIREAGDRFSGKGWSLRLTPIPALKIGIVEMDRFRVEIEFDGLTDDEQDRFMRRFTLYYQRGGG
ncbi:MAG: hypothetical protein K9K30_07670 [Burkholderiaceae bacterium]|nr:hypothetical protein [Sulfuritalea sp.]MCF8175102.1 hypothetical protein [Burkholderiaceae bacterium]MCF8185143.1 hypothetical protein [Polynucleobacter sp.]